MWNIFLKEIGIRLTKPWSQPPFVLYFIFSIIIVGGGGVFATLISEYNSTSSFDWVNVSKAGATYFIAILAVTFADLNMDEKLKFFKSYFLLSLILLFIGIVLLVVAFSINNLYSLLFSIVGVLLSYFLWIVANGLNEKYEEKSYDRSIRDDAYEKGHGQNWGNNG